MGDLSQVPIISGDLIEQVRQLIPEETDSIIQVNIHFDQYIQNVFLPDESYGYKLIILVILVGVGFYTVFSHKRQMFRKLKEMFKSKKSLQEEVHSYFGVSKEGIKEYCDKSSSTKSTPKHSFHDLTPENSINNSKKLTENLLQINDKLIQDKQIPRKNSEQLNFSGISSQEEISIQGKVQTQMSLPAKSQEIFFQKMVDSPKRSAEFVHYQQDCFENGRYKRMFVEMDHLGDGAFGQVYKAQHRIEEHVYAVKKIYFPIKQHFPIQQHKFFKEVLNLINLNHKHVLRLFNSWIEEPDEGFMTQFLEESQKKKNRSSFGSDTDKSLQVSQELKFDQDSYREFNSEQMKNQEIITNILPMFNEEDQIPLILYIQMQYCFGKTLGEYLSLREDINDFQNFNFFSQILLGLEYIHRQNIIHRDLKQKNNVRPSNIFIDHENIIIGDFGVSTDKHIGPYVQASNNEEVSMTAHIGTPMYMAPEQFGSTHYDKKIDIYALGYILFEMYCQHSTFHEKCQNFKNIRNLQQLPESMDKYGVQKQLILMMCVTNPEERPNIQQIFSCKAYKQWKKESCAHNY